MNPTPVPPIHRKGKNCGFATKIRITAIPRIIIAVLKLLDPTSPTTGRIRRITRNIYFHDFLLMMHYGLTIAASRTPRQFCVLRRLEGQRSQCQPSFGSIIFPSDKQHGCGQHQRNSISDPGIILKPPIIHTGHQIHGKESDTGRKKLFT